MPPSTQDSLPPALEPTAPKEHVGGEKRREETLREEDNASTTPKDLRFWLIILGLLVATFISALDLTGNNIHYLLHPSLPES
jgi:hypothetical protein